MSLLKKWQRRKLKKPKGKTVEKTGGAKVGDKRG